MVKGDWKWAVGTIIAIIAILASTGFFNTANIVRVRPVWTDNVCPLTIYEDIDFEFRNGGNKDTILCVKVWSNELNFTKYQDCLYMEPGLEGTKFTFKVNRGSFPSQKQNANVTIYNELSYKKNSFQIESGVLSCNYKVTDYNLQLIEI